MDQGFMHYVAYLINEHSFIPYRDIFELNMPVSYLFHMAVGKFLGYSDTAFTTVNVIWLTATLTVTWLIMKPFGKTIAFSSCLLFSIIYLQFGSRVMLQRDLIAILPIAISILITTGRTPFHRINLINFLNGVLFAIATLIKPHLVIGLPAIIIYNCIYVKDSNNSLKIFIKKFIVGSLFAVLGFIITLAIPFLWLWKMGAIPAFWDIFSSYIPLYSEISGGLKIVEGDRRMGILLHNIYHNLKQFDIGILIISSLGGVYLVLKYSSSVTKRKLASLLLSLTLIYIVYVIIAGKFWDYHWMPFKYFACLCTALLLFNFSSSLNFPKIKGIATIKILPFFFFVLLSFILTVKPAYNAFKQLRYDATPSWLYRPDYYIMVEEIETYLHDNLSPNDKVQTLDWIHGGSIHAMLRAKAVTATRYITDFQFYHHVSNPYIQNLRKDFLTQLEQEMPKFIIKVQAEAKPKISGKDTNYKFPELDEFITEYYDQDYSGTGFDIYRRDDN
ncbi:MAG: hypothetical protein MGF17_02760 [Trichodesmium sp. MAG_R04]|nr:hypothetical protein [Trichodesmium sp. MAG_R04]